MNYYIEQKKNILITLFIVFTLLFFTFYRIRYLVPGIAEHLGSFLLYPCLKLQHYIIEPIKTITQERKKVVQLMQDITALEQTCDILRAQNYALQSAQDYMQDIQELIAFKKRFSQAHIAQILVRHISPEEHFMYVDAGALSHITVNMLALYNNIIIGHVVAVYPWYSKVQLATDPRSRISVYAMQTKARGIFKGIGVADRGELTRVSHLETIQVGDQLFSSGDGLLYPRGYMVGSVTSCKSQDLYHTVHVSSAANIEHIHYCTLINRA